MSTDSCFKILIGPFLAAILRGLDRDVYDDWNSLMLSVGALFINFFTLTVWSLFRYSSYSFEE